MSLVREISARQLGIVALVIWGCSLGLTGLVLYSDQKHIQGTEILVLGWLSPLVLNFAWFANVFFLYGAAKILIGKVPTKSAVIAALLSLDTFRATRFPLNEAGGESPIYGYGWGAILWFLSIFLLLAAVGIRKREIYELLDQRGMQERLLPLGLWLALMTIGITSYFAIHDRIVANRPEAQRLNSIAFKRGPVCGTPEPVVASPINNLTGPVEIVAETNLPHAKYLFTRVRDLLEWGIPTIRIGSTDYFLESATGSRMLTSVRAAGTPTVVLFVSESTPKKTIRARLVETGTGRIVFDQTWVRENHPPNIHYYCPDYGTFSSTNGQPRTLVVQALGLHEIAASANEMGPQTNAFKRVDGTVIGRKDGNRASGTKELSQKGTASVNYHDIFNTNCPNDIGWNARDHNAEYNAGRPFRVRDKTYYLAGLDGYHAICEEHVAYIYSGSSRDGTYYLNIQKRDLRDFQQVWARNVAISDISRLVRDNGLTVRSVIESSGGITLELADEDSEKVLIVQAPLGDK